MTDRYVNPAVGASGTGGSWAQAYKTLKEATDAAAAGETIYFANGTEDVVTVDTTYTLAAGVRVISTSDTTNNPPTTYATGATVSTTTNNTNYNIAGTCAWFGVTFAMGDASDAVDIRFAAGDGDIQLWQDCAFTFGGTGANAGVYVGTNSDNIDCRLRLVNCTFTFAATTQGFALNGGFSEFIGCNLSAGATHPSTLFELSTRNQVIELIGCDVSGSETLFTSGPAAILSATLRQCKIYNGGTIFAPTPSGGSNATLYDCAAGDTHIHLAHYDYLGSTVISESIYAVGNIADSNLSWVVAGSANASAVAPYKSPWLSVYHSGTSAITPNLECVRSGSSTAYTEAEVWSEWTAKVTSGSTRATLYSNRTAPLATPANNETGALGASDWTGENATSWFGKLQPNSSITPAEAGYISARVCIGGNHTVYVDPQIRGLS